MSSKNLHWKGGFKRRFNKKKVDDTPSHHNCVSGIRDPIIFSNHINENCIDSRRLFPKIPQFFQAAFIDPGRVSCAIRIVRYYVDKNIFEVLWFGIHNFGTDIPDIIVGMEREIDPIKDMLRLCHHIVIESQLMKSQVNYRTFQHMISYIEGFVRNQGMKAVIFEVDIALKTVFIGGPRCKSQNNNEEIKSWSRKKAREISLLRCDFVTLSILENSLKKQDEDYSDTVCYDFAWWFYIGKIETLNWKK
uniref:Uncharacterized protein n=1 Tax=viral metagenome TaxID=1070528 RepID=A0A6C0BDM4_9ZZZZ